MATVGSPVRESLQGPVATLRLPLLRQVFRTRFMDTFFARTAHGELGYLVRILRRARTRCRSSSRLCSGLISAVNQGISRGGKKGIHMDSQKLERQKHPTFDRDLVRSWLIGFAVMLMTTIGALRSVLGLWATVMAAIAFLGGLVIWLRQPVNVCLCPRCKNLLCREPETCEFSCSVCRIEWFTSSSGYNFADRWRKKG